MVSERVVIVTGGASGIGLATVQRFLADGYVVSLCGRREKAIADAIGQLDNKDRVLGLVADVASPTQCEEVVADTVAKFGGVDALVNAHGVIGDFTSIEDTTPQGWSDVLSINLMGAIYMTTAALPHLRERRGSVVNVASLNHIQAEPNMAPYGVSKAGLVAFTKYAACEFAADGVRVNGIAPGWIRTPMGEPFFEEAGVVGKTWETNFLGRAGEPEEMASVIVFLAGPGASFITGETVTADGGHGINMMPLRPK
jgi:NAD(P)-dependent dehydrogenase (short-subunit alcohol dehydrogenase family)